jgi:hypothetical protein
MTREEADGLQVAIDNYLKIKEGAGIKSPGAVMAKTMLANRLAREIPDLDIGGVDGNLLLGAFAGLLKSLVPKVSTSSKVVTVPVVDGHTEVDYNSIDEDEFHAMYCIRIPIDVAHEAVHLNSVNALFKSAMKGAENE